MNKKLLYTLFAVLCALSFAVTACGASAPGSDPRCLVVDCGSATPAAPAGDGQNNVCVPKQEDAALGINFTPLVPGGSITEDDNNGVVYNVVCNASGDGDYTKTVVSTPETVTPVAPSLKQCVIKQEDASKGIYFQPLDPGHVAPAKDINGVTYIAACNANGDGTYTLTVVSTPVPTNTPVPATVTPISGSPAHNGNADALLANPPYKFVIQKDETGKNVTTLEGFDLGEFGGNDAACTRTGDTEYVHIGEVVGSQSEKCLSVAEWSLKVGDKTILSGTYALHPGEWFYIPLAVSGQNDSPRIVGTLYLLPKGWNSHMYAADLATARDTRDGTLSIVGLSPTDPWVVAIAEALLK